MIVFTFNRESPSAFPVATIPRIARACSLLKKTYQSKDYQVGVAFMSEAAIQKMNQQYRKKNKPTDVLSFSSQEGLNIVTKDASEPIDLGDLMICPTYAAREAKRRGIDKGEELVRLLVHGTLHLMGFDHADEPSEHRMFRIQESIVEKAMTRV